MIEYYLAFDLGAESGRAILGELDDTGYLQLRELHRFPNHLINTLGNLHWDVSGLYAEMIKGIRICATSCTSSPISIGVDTWGADYGLFDARGALIGMPFSYRDLRTQGIKENVFQKIPREELYQFTGLQLLSTNTIIGNRQIYTSSMGEGKTAVEKQKKGNAVEEIKNLSEQILSEIK